MVLYILPLYGGPSSHVGNHFKMFMCEMIEGVLGKLCGCLTPKGWKYVELAQRMNRNDLEQYLDIENVDVSLDLFAGALAVKHISTLIAYGGNRYGRHDP